MNAQLINIINIMMMYTIGIFCACMIMVLMYACAMRTLHHVRMYDAVVCTRTHGDAPTHTHTYTTCEYCKGTYEGDTHICAFFGESDLEDILPF